MADPIPHQTRPHDVLVIGAGGAGLRAAIAARDAGADVGLVCKSLLGKAHTVMAEGGVAAALRNVASADSWQIHFRDTMIGGKYLNNPRMAQLHAQEAPARVRELEYWGAVFDRTTDGRILQRPFGGHTHPRLAHVGDRTGLEMIRTLQDRAVAAGIDVYMECTVTRLTTGSRGVTGAFGYWRTTGRPILFPAKAIVLATGGIGKAYEVTSNSWEYSGDGQALAYDAGADLIDMEFVQFHPTGMVWPPGVRGLLVTEAVRGEGGVLRNKDGERFMWKYLPEERRHEYAATDEEASRWVDRPERRSRDRRSSAARAVHPGQRRAGHLHGGPRGPRLAARRGLPRHQLSATRPRPTQAPLDVRAVQGARRRRYHQGADGGGPDHPLRHGRHPGRRRERRDHGPRALRRRRGGRRYARRQPARWQLALGPAGLRGAHRDGRGRPRDDDRRRRVRGSLPGGVGGRRTGRAARARRRRGPVCRAARPAGDDAATGGHLPRGVGPRRSDRRARRAAPALGGRPSERWTRLQPRLEPGVRARPPADDLRGDHPQRSPAHREPRRAQPSRPSGHR